MMMVVETLDRNPLFSRFSWHIPMYVYTGIIMMIYIHSLHRLPDDIIRVAMGSKQPT